MKYTGTEFHCLFKDYGDALSFSQSPYFSGENPGQNRVSTLIAKAPDVEEFLVVFTLYHAPADTEEVTNAVRVLAKSYQGALDGEEIPEKPAPEPEPEPEPAPAATPW